VNYIKMQRKSLNLRFHKLRHLLRPSLSLENKIIMYKRLLIHPAMTYDIQLWGTTKILNFNKLQSFHSINFRQITNASWFVSNRTLHHYLNICTISIIGYTKFHGNARNHANPSISNLSSVTTPDNPPRRLKRKWPRDLLNS